METCDRGKKDIDTSYQTYGEALVGLARRKDKRVIEVLLTELKSELESDYVGELVRQAAEEIDDSKLYAALKKLKDSN